MPYGISSFFTAIWPYCKTLLSRLDSNEFYEHIFDFQHKRSQFKTTKNILDGQKSLMYSNGMVEQKIV